LIGRVSAIAVLVSFAAAAPAMAQQKPPAQTPPPRSPTMPKPAPQKPKIPRQYRWFLALGGGVQLATSDLADNFTFESNAETGTADVEYASKAAPTIDIAIGRRLWKTGGIAAGFSRSSFSATAHVDADVPHPFFDNQDREVSGDVPDVGRTEMAAHVQLFWMREHRKWRTRVLGGITYFNVEQDVVTAVNVNETYPYDTAEFRSGTTASASGTGLGFNAGVDVAWMQTPQFGWGAAVRFTRGSVDLDVTGGRNVSTDAGGAQAVAGIRIAF
jgi:hypothetical protein